MSNPGKGFQALINQILEHLPDADGQDFVLQVLRGHLIVEQQLREVLAAELPHVEYVLQADLEFSDLLKLVKALRYDGAPPWVWGGIAKLNRIRNDYAHNLQPTEIKKHLFDFVSLVKSNTIWHDEAMNADHVRDCITSLAMAIHRLHSPRDN